MGKIGLSIFAIHVSDKNAKDMELHNIYEGKSLIDIVEKFIDDNSNSYDNDEKKENIFKCEEKIIVKKTDDMGSELYTYICGTVKTGEYGEEVEVVDIQTGEITHIIGTDEASVMPFKFCIVVPAKGLKGTAIGLAMLQTNGGYGIKGVLEGKLKKYIQKLNSSTVFYMGNICPISYINKFLSDNYLKKIRLVRYNIPTDDAEKMGINNGVSTTYEELSICRPVGFITRKKPKIKEYLLGKRAYTSIIELPQFPYDDLKFEFKMGGNMKTMSMKNLSRIVVTEDISDKINLSNGHPTNESMLEVFDDLSKEYLEEMELIEKLE